MAPLTREEEQIVAAFDRAWRTGTPPTWPTGIRPRVLCELAAIDLEYRRRSHAAGAAPADALGGEPRVEDYQRLIAPLLFSTDELAELAAEEYRARRLWSDRPAADHFVARFADLESRLVARMRQIDAEIVAEGNSPANVVADPRAPLSYRDFLIHEHLGSGGMGRVYRATQRSLGRQVAIKTLRKQLTTHAAAVEQFLQEGRILAGLQCSRIVGVHGAGRFPGGGYFLALDYIDGANLQTIRDRERLSPEDCARITLDAVSAVRVAHSRGVVHGDLKPANVLRHRDGRVFVVDFGLACFLADQTRPGGTRQFLPPEFDADATARPSIAADIFGLGGILLYLLTRQTPREVSLPLTFATFEADTPPALIEVCRRALQPRPEDRYSTAGEMSVALSLTHHKLPPNAAAPPPDPSTSE